MNQDPLIGQQLDEYQLETLLGQGGMARVYRAADVRLRRYAAVKVIDTPFQSDTSYTKRFEREAQAIAQLEHPHIVRLYRYGDVDNLLYMAMQYVEGVNLHTMLLTYEDQGELIAPDDMRRINREICVALDYAHSKGVIHRDMKPANVLIDPDGHAIVTDFGLALMTEMGTQGEILGTPQYIAPEQAISSAGAVPQSDLYAVGVMLYRMATGALPFDDEDSLAVVMQHVTEPPPLPSEKRPSINPRLEAVILKTLAKEPAARYTTGAELADAVDEALQGILPTAEPALSILDRVSLNLDHLPPLPAAVTSPPAAPTPIGPATPTLPEAQPERRLPIQPGAVVFGVLLLLIFAFFWLRGGGEAEDLEPAAQAGVTTAVASPVASPTSAQLAEATDLMTATAVTTNPNPAESTQTINLLPLITSESSPTETPTAVPTLTATAEPPSPTPEPTATETAPAVTSYSLLFVADDNTLFLVNQSARAFPLNSFSLVTTEKNVAILSNWERDSLAGGHCVRIDKNDKARERPLPDTCSQVNGNPIIFRWKNDFTIHHNGNVVQTCDVKRDTCEVIISDS